MGKPFTAATSASAAVQRKSGRSKVTNGKRFILGIDHRNPWIRRAKDLVAAHLSDVPDASTAQCSLIRRCAVLTVQLEQLERKFALANGNADAADLDLYQKTANTLRRHLETLGLHRRAKPVPDLDLYRDVLPSLSTPTPVEASDDV